MKVPVPLQTCKMLATPRNDVSISFASFPLAVVLKPLDCYFIYFNGAQMGYLHISDQTNIWPSFVECIKQAASLANPPSNLRLIIDRTVARCFSPYVASGLSLSDCVTPSQKQIIFIFLSPRRSH